MSMYGGYSTDYTTLYTGESFPVQYDIQGVLNAMAGTTGLDERGAANVLAGLAPPHDLDLVAALNVAAGTSGLAFNAVCNDLANITDPHKFLDAQGALNVAGGSH